MGTAPTFLETVTSFVVCIHFAGGLVHVALHLLQEVRRQAFQLWELNSSLELLNRFYLFVVLLPIA